MSLFRLLSSLCLSMALVACGGGGGGGGDTTPPNSAPSANAGAALSLLAGATATLDGSASTDPEGAALTYSWVLSSRPAASTATLSSPSAARPGFTADVPGSYVATLTVSDGRLTSTPSTVAVTAVPTDTLTIRTDKTDPLTGTVQLSLSDSTFGAPVSWYLDLGAIGTGPTLAWNTAQASNAPHLLLARIQLGTDKWGDIRRTVTVANSSIQLTATASGTSAAGDAGVIFVDVDARAPAGIASVSASLDGAAPSTLTAPNYCRKGCTFNDLYRFTVDTLKAGTGDHVMTLTAVDGSGASQQIQLPVPISNAPQLTLNSPADGGFVFDKLPLAGRYTTDKPGPVTVTVTAYLAGLQIFQTTAPDFSFSYDIAGLAPGPYLLSVTATDSTGQSSTRQRQVFVTASAARVYTPVRTLGTSAQLLAAEGRLALYATADGSVRLLDTTAGTETLLQGGAIARANDWQISDGRVVAYGQGDDCTATSTCIYLWRADGTRVNLTASNPWAGSSHQLHPVVRGGQVIWCNDATPGSYTLYDIASGSYAQVAAPAGVTGVGNNSYDLAVGAGAVDVVYWASTGGTGAAVTYDIYRWNSATRTSTRLSTPGGRSVYPLTDGGRVAWLQLAAETTPSDPNRLVSQPLAGGATTQVSSAALQTLLQDGLLVWREYAAPNEVLKASTATGAAVTLSTAASVRLHGTRQGTVVYGENGKVYRWKAGQATLLIDSTPTLVKLGGGALYFTMGDSQALYRLPLD